MVGSETRATVGKLLRGLGCRPHWLARRRRLKDGRVHRFGMIIPDIQRPFYAEIARGVAAAAKASESALQLCNSDEKLQKERFSLDVLRSEFVDARVQPPCDDTDAAVIDLAVTGRLLGCVDRSLAKL